jgi:hypothetical protein
MLAFSYVSAPDAARVLDLIGFDPDSTFIAVVPTSCSCCRKK